MTREELVKAILRMPEEIDAAEIRVTHTVESMVIASNNLEALENSYRLSSTGIPGKNAEERTAWLHSKTVNCRAMLENKERSHRHAQSNLKKQNNRFRAYLAVARLTGDNEDVKE